MSISFYTILLKLHNLNTTQKHYIVFDNLYYKIVLIKLYNQNIQKN